MIRNKIKMENGCMQHLENRIRTLKAEIYPSELTV
jgi:hypothetical protein